MRNHGFFDETSKKGIWLAGDYSGAEVVRIPCDNDKDTKQGTTSAMMARLGVSIFVQRILPGTSSGQMVELLRRSSHGSDSSYFARSDAVNRPLARDRVTHGKIGLGDLKTGGNVYSDLNAINNPVGGGGDFTVCYTNVDYNPYAIQDVLTAVQDAISAYQGIAVAPAASGPAAPPPAARVSPPAARATP